MTLHLQGGGIQQQVDHLIIEKIHELVGAGVRSVNEMRRHLRGFVEKEMFAGMTKPALTNRRFNPTRKDVRNHIYRATVKQRFSNCDQTNVSKVVDKWIEQYPEDKFHFRPYADIDKTESSDGDDNGEDEEDVKIVTPLSRQKLLFVHQTEWQRHLLSRYGNDICLLDATHKTTRYALPLFFIAVRTNVDYQIVGSFVVQDESTESIREALGFFAKWNQQWKPSYFMVDCCEEEINAIEETFAGNLHELSKHSHSPEHFRVTAATNTNATNTSECKQ